MLLTSILFPYREALRRHNVTVAIDVHILCDFQILIFCMIVRFPSINLYIIIHIVLPGFSSMDGVAY